MNRRQCFVITTMSLSVMLFLNACGGQAQPQPQNTPTTKNQRDVTYPGVGGVTLAGTLNSLMRISEQSNKDRRPK